MSKVETNKREAAVPKALRQIIEAARPRSLFKVVFIQSVTSFQTIATAIAKGDIENE